MSPICLSVPSCPLESPQVSGLGPGGVNSFQQALADKPSSRQSFLYTGPSLDLENIQQRAGGVSGGPPTSDGAQQRRSMVGENGGVPHPHAISGDGPKMVRFFCRFDDYILKCLQMGGNGKAPYIISPYPRPCSRPHNYSPYPRLGSRTHT